MLRVEVFFQSVIPCIPFIPVKVFGICACGFATFTSQLTAVFAIEDGSILDDFLPSPKRKLVEAWIEIHKDELIADWQLAVNGETVFKIRGLEQ